MGLEVMWVHTHMQRHKQHNEQCATQTPLFLNTILCSSRKRNYRPI